MKKIIALLMAVIMMLSFAACSDKPVVDNPEDTPPVAEEVKPEIADPEIAEFYEKYVSTDKRPVAVMVDNDNEDARPQAGLDEAYLVYEMVIEGGSTRFMALFNNTNVEKIGPVRSSRHYFLDFVMENDAIYTHFGWSPKATTDISAFNINNINGVLGSDESVFWRERKHANDWHSAYTSIEKVTALANKKGYNEKTNHKNGIKYATEYIDVSPMIISEGVSLKYSGYVTSYTYDKDKKVYLKSIGKNPHNMQNGKTLEFKNVIIMLIADTSLGDGTARREINTVGSGKGYYFTDGAYEEITWSKSSRSANTEFKKADGTELIINPGKTIINLFSPSYELTIK